MHIYKVYARHHFARKTIEKYGKRIANAGFTESYLYRCNTYSHQAAFYAFDGIGEPAHRQCYYE